MENLIPEIQTVVTSSEFIFFALVFSAVVLLVLGGASLVASRNPVERRMQTHVRPNAQGGAGRISGARPGDKKLRSQASATNQKNGKRVSIVRQRLVRAGYPGPNAVRIYFIVRIILALVLPLALLLAIPVFMGSLPPQKLMIIGLAASVFGFYLPTLWVRHKTKVRQRDAREGFPDALDMLLVCVEAGLSLAAALSRVGNEIGAARPLLGEQFKLVALEMQAGTSREQALRNLAERIGIDEVSSLVTLLLQSESLGTSIGQSLRVHSEEMRVHRMLRAEEQANKLPAKISIPLVLFILPCLLIVILSPAMLRLVNAMSQTAH